MPKRTFRSPLTRMLREAAAACDEAEARGMPLDEVTGEREERKARAFERRDFLKTAGAALAAAVLARPARLFAASQPRVVIVGAGAAGLRCAHKLWKTRGWTSTVYEASDEIGGRIETLRGAFSAGQIVEQHAEFISTEHKATMALAGSLGLLTEDVSRYPRRTSDTYWFGGSRYTQAQLNADWKSFGWATFNNAVKLAPWPTTWDHYNPTALSWDLMSVPEWIAANVPGGTGTKFGKLLLEDVTAEYGGDPADQSALNLVYVLGYYDSSRTSHGYQPKNVPVLAGTDEKYHVQGGNDQLITGMLGELPAGTVETGQRLAAVEDNGDGTYTCTFESGFATTDVIADRVVLAIPFKVLRDVDLTRAGLSDRKRTAIDEMGMGTNAKIHLQFATRVWNQSSYTGVTIADNGAGSAWDATNYQAGTPGILTDFPGGAAGAALPARYGLTADEGPAPAAMVADVLSYLEPIFPGVTGAYNGLSHYHTGLLNPFIGGAYSYWRVGQYTGFSGYESVSEGGIHFAGEHTSRDFQGYMEGAITSGERAANEL